VNRRLVKQFLRFLVVGGVGFVVDGGLLFVLVSADVDPYLARGLSFPVAVTVTWYLKRIWTFAETRDHDPKRQFGGYLAVQLTGAGGNYVCYAAVLAFLPQTVANAMIAFAVGSAFGLSINFVGARSFVFSERRERSMRPNLSRRRA
jgi:putative flippase GtrA